jgi:hypothetical protein
VGIEKVELYVDSIATGIIDETEPYSLAWNTVAYEDGAHIILFVLMIQVEIQPLVNR